MKTTNYKRSPVGVVKYLVRNMEVYSLSDICIKLSYKGKRGSDKHFTKMEYIINRPTNMDDDSWRCVIANAKLISLCGSHITPVTFSKDGWDFGIVYDEIFNVDNPALIVFKECTDKMNEFNSFKYYWDNNPTELFTRNIQDIIEDNWDRPIPYGVIRSFR